jgi:hypothetical protein
MFTNQFSFRNSSRTWPFDGPTRAPADTTSLRAATWPLYGDHENIGDIDPVLDAFGIGPSGASGELREDGCTSASSGDSPWQPNRGFLARHSEARFVGRLRAGGIWASASASIPDTISPRFGCSWGEQSFDSVARDENAHPGQCHRFERTRARRGERGRDAVTARSVDVVSLRNAAIRESRGRA